MQSRENSRDAVDSLSLKLAIYAALPPEQKPLIPFMLIQEVLPEYLEKIYALAASSANSVNNSDYALISSCFNTYYVMAIIFLGETLARKLFRKMNKEISVEYAIELPTHAKWSWTVSGLIGGGVMYELMKDTNNPGLHFKKFPKLGQYTKPASDDFLKHINPYLNEILVGEVDDASAVKKMENLFSTLPYDFNALTFSKMKSEIESNKHQTSINKSHIYLCATLYPTNDKADIYTYYHCFVLEQFYLSSVSEVHYRIYQSCINQATLFDYIEGCQYGKLGEQPLTEEEIYSFINKVELFYSAENKANDKMTAKECFGYDGVLLPGMKYAANKLSGHSVRFFASGIEPDACSQNLMNFLKRGQA